MTPTAAARTPALLSVEQVAQILRLNVRTVRNYVRSGALKATRIGKQYRIGLADLEAFAGGPVATHRERVLSPVARVEISSIINMEGITPALASRISNMLATTADVLRSIEQPVAVSSTYDEHLDRLRVLLAAELKSTRNLLAMINAALEEPAAMAPI
ncbi:MAG TPA: helix-turn-helix domain-containing protein [Steroidobacteraceae bacterium]